MDARAVAGGLDGANTLLDEGDAVRGGWLIDKGLDNDTINH